MTAIVALMITSLAALLAGRPLAERAAFLESLTPDEALVLKHTWGFWARPGQLPPAGNWSTWLVLAGRGYGKTKIGSEQVSAWAEELGPGGRIALVGKDPSDIRKTMIEGQSGILACALPWFRPYYEPSKRELVWPNGCKGFTYSAEVPDDLRGPQHHKFWGDELCKWKRAQETWDNLQFGLRLGDNPQGVITTTPRPIATLRELLDDPSTVVTRGSTYDNAVNLPQKFLNTILRKYEGTRLGRQELRAELLTDTPGALWTLALIEEARRRQAPTLVRIGVAVDPGANAGKDAESENLAETGIIAGGIDEHGHLNILDDASGSMSPAEWGRRAIEVHDQVQADFIVAEANNGGEMVRHVIQTSARDMNRFVRVELVHASRGKQTRAEPVSALYEQGRVHHIGAFPELEDQMSTWIPGMKSPDRMDALVWLVSMLALDAPPIISEDVLSRGAGGNNSYGGVL